jgi:acyl-CoA thioesterase II
MFGMSELVAGLRMDAAADGLFEVPNWNYYASSGGGAAAAAVADVIPGGQLLAQAVVAARQLQPVKTVKSIHAVFARSGRVSESTEVLVQTVQDGRSVGTIVFTFSQKGRPFATATLLLHVPDEDVVRHAVTRPSGPTPTDERMRVVERGTHEFAYPPGTELTDPDEVGPAEQPIWVRFPGAPDDDAIFQALIAFVTNFQLVGIAMRPHAGLAEHQSHLKVSTGVLAHSVSFHEPFDAREWLLLDQRVPWAGKGRFYGCGNVFTGNGALVASFTQEGLLRALSEHQGKGATL